MKHLDLFSGIAGFALACEWAGIETIGFVEKDQYCQKVLRKHYSAVPIVEDIRNVEKIKEVIANVTGKRFIPGAKEPAILITAGFPCQPFSVAGKRGGEGDDRYLWPETLTVIEAIKPTWVLLENVAGIINLALDTVLSDLEGADYSCETLIIPACAVNAPHRRDRVWIVAFSTRDGSGCQQYKFGDSRIQQDCIRRQGMGDELSNSSQDVADSERRKSRQQTKQEGRKDTGRGSEEDVANTKRKGLEGADTEGGSCRTRQPSEYGHGGRQADWWAVEPELGRVAHGIPNRVDRLKCLGNAIVPQIAYEIIKVIKEFDDVQGKT